MVDRALIERLLSDIRTNMSDLRDAKDIDWQTYQTDKRARRFVERTLHVSIEACLDIVHHIISDRQFREPASYRDAFTVLAENGIFYPDELGRFQNMASFRNLLVHYYERVDDAVVFGLFRKNLSDIDLFVERISGYLETEDARDGSG
jgi:uncharacterized protein YutE (UPF0331/DUF86 family)